MGFLALFDVGLKCTQAELGAVLGNYERFPRYATLMTFDGTMRTSRRSFLEEDTFLSVLKKVASSFLTPHVRLIISDILASFRVWGFWFGGRDEAVIKFELLLGHRTARTKIGVALDNTKVLENC